MSAAKIPRCLVDARDNHAEYGNLSPPRPISSRYILKYHYLNWHPRLSRRRWARLWPVYTGPKNRSQTSPGGGLLPRRPLLRRAQWDSLFPWRLNAPEKLQLAANWFSSWARRPLCPRLSSLTACLLTIYAHARSLGTDVCIPARIPSTLITKQSAH